jgi:hypothetical protein
MALLTAILAILGGASLLTHYWLRDPAKQRIANFLDSRWLKLSYASPTRVPQLPLRVLRKLLDLGLGERIFSLRAFIRISIVGNIVLISALGVAGIFSHQPFAGVAPWKIYDSNGDIARGLLLRQPNDNLTKIPGALAFCQYFASSHGVIVRYGYGALFCALTFITNAILDFVSVAMARQMLRELERNRGYLTFIAALVFNIVIALIVASLAVSIVALLATPIFWPTLLMCIKLSTINVLLFVTFLAIFNVLVWVLVGTAIKIEVIVAVLPTLIISFVLLWAVASSPSKRQIQAALSAILLRLADSGKSAFVWVAGILAAISMIIGGLACFL